MFVVAVTRKLRSGESFFRKIGGTLFGRDAILEDNDDMRGFVSILVRYIGMIVFV